VWSLERVSSPAVLGAVIDGSSIALSADHAPRHPCCTYYRGGVVYAILLDRFPNRDQHDCNPDGSFKHPSRHPHATLSEQTHAADAEFRVVRPGENVIHLP
jgi:hypothetical protein